MSMKGFHNTELLEILWYHTTEVLGGQTAAKVFPYETIAQATNDFDLRRNLGNGRFGPVFQVRTTWSLHRIVGFISCITWLIHVVLFWWRSMGRSICAGRDAGWIGSGSASSSLELQTGQAGVCQGGQEHDGSTAPECCPSLGMLLHHLSLASLRVPSQ